MSGGQRGRSWLGSGSARSRALAAVFFVGTWLVLLASSCGDTSHSKGQPGIDMPTTVVDLCPGTVVRRCDCPNGVTADSECDDKGKQVCACESCKEQPLDTPESVTPCGGEPFGEWRIASVNAKGFKVNLSYTASSGDVNTGVCGTHLDRPPEGYDLRMILADGGDAQLFVKGVPVTFRMLDSCYRSVIRQSCDDGLNCKLDECGVCTCTFPFGTDADLPSAQWTRTATSLSFALSDKSTLKVDYCRNGDTLQLLGSDGSVFVLERVSRYGIPAPCETRSLETCLIGANKIAVDATNCQIGICKGDAKCVGARAEADCTNRQGCTWDPTKCSGLPFFWCDLGDYGLVPGCEFQGPTARCEGTSVPCAGKNTTECKRTFGCKVNFGRCLGGTFCVGSSQSVCTPSLGCTWDATPLCEGTPMDCASLKIEVCAATPGCTSDQRAAVADGGAADGPQ